MMTWFTSAAIIGASGCFLIWFALVLRNNLSTIAASFSKLPRYKKLLVVCAIAICTAYAQKPPRNSIRAPQRVASNSSTYTMPNSADLVGTWHLRGAYQDVTRVDMQGFKFPLGNRLVSSFWVDVWGGIREMLSSPTNDIEAIGTPMSAVPGESRLWTEHGTNSFIITWENFVSGRRLASEPITSSPYISAQIELHDNGDYIVRSNEVEQVVRRVNPDDWDNDGIENEIDIHPNEPDPEAFGPYQDLSVVSNENAYCWVDVVVRQANAKVNFIGDGPSNLADPSFIAKAGEVCRVTLLIGKSYVVTSAMPIEIVGQSSDEISVSRESESSIRILWPVTFEAEMRESRMARTVGEQRDFMMRVSPMSLSLAGDFVWTSSCCPISGSGLLFSMRCRSNCDCRGCTIEGRYDYEGYTLPVQGIFCGCHLEDNENETSDREEDTETNRASVSVKFSKNAIIFEDAYDNTPTEHVAKRSTQSKLTISASGGIYGATLGINIVGEDKLDAMMAASLPEIIVLEPGEEYEQEILYEGSHASNGKDDVVVTATIVENETDIETTESDRLTVVKVELIPERLVNNCVNRHRFGVCERIICSVMPMHFDFDVQPLNGADTTTGLVDRRSPIILCPDFETGNIIQVVSSEVCYTPETFIVAPAALRFCNVRQRSSDLQVGVPGGAGMSIDVHIEPNYVSFMELKFREVPSTESSISGYFSNVAFSNVWYHNTRRGAGRWHTVGLENYFFTDEAMMMDALIMPCFDGHIYWTIPIVWTRNWMNGVEHLLDTVQQKFDMNNIGTLRVSKFGFWVERALSGQLTSSEGVQNE